jgi:hypothetical protein
MKRRKFIAGLLAAASMTGAQAQSKTQYRIAVVQPSTPIEDIGESSSDPFYRPFFQELRRLGYIEGETLVVDRYSAEGRAERFSQIAPKCDLCSIVPYSAALKRGYFNNPQAAEKLGVQRSTFQNWEHERVPIPRTTEFACETIAKRMKQRLEFGPVILVYADSPIWPGPEGKHEARVVQCEFYNNNESALTRVRLLASGSMLHNPAILDPDGPAVATLLG